MEAKMQSAFFVQRKQNRNISVLYYNLSEIYLPAWTNFILYSKNKI